MTAAAILERLGALAEKYGLEWSEDGYCPECGADSARHEVHLARCAMNAALCDFRGWKAARKAASDAREPEDNADFVARLKRGG